MIDDLATTVETRLVNELGGRRLANGEIECRCPWRSEHSTGDQNPSFNWNTVKKAGVCRSMPQHKGGVIAVARRLGIQLPEKKGVGPRRIIATYDYLNEGGALVSQTVRFLPKGFAQRRPLQPDDDIAGLRAHKISVDDTWVWSLQRLEAAEDVTCEKCGGAAHRLVRVPLVLYRLPELLTADPSETIYVVEGEKDADALAKLGLVATTNPMGAGKWRGEFNAFLRTRTVVLLPDNDDAGRQHACEIASSLFPVASCLKVIASLALPKKGDVSDWLKAGGTRQRLEALVAAAHEWTRAEEADVGPGELSSRAHTEEPHLTDLGNAQRLVAAHGNDLRYCADRGGWFVWTRQRWARDATGEVMRCAKTTVLELYQKAGTLIDDEVRAKLVNWARTSESERHLNAIVALAASELKVAVRPNVWDANPWVLNVANGTLDLRTGELRSHRREDLLTKLAPVLYDANATHPLWDKFLRDTTGDDAEMIGFLQRFAGYTLTGDTSEDVLVLAHGPEASGKSTFVEALKATLGDYALTTDFETFLKRPASGSPRNDLARLVGARLVVSMEVEDGKALAEGVVKALTGGDTVTTRLLYKEFFEYVPQFKLLLAANHAPKVRDDDGAMWRRIRRAPFEHTVPKEKRDPTVKARLKNPADGGPAVLAWAVRGCLVWQRDGLGVPPKVEEATAAYRAEMDPLRDFIAERCVVAPGAWATIEGLWTAYERWAQDAGEKYPLTRRQFGDRLARRGFGPDKGTGGARVRRGIGLIATEADDDRVAEAAHGGARSEKFAHEGDLGESLRDQRHSPPLAPLAAGDEQLPFGGDVE